MKREADLSALARRIEAVEINEKAAQEIFQAGHQALSGGTSVRMKKFLIVAGVALGILSAPRIVFSCFNLYFGPEKIIFNNRIYHGNFAPLSEDEVKRRFGPISPTGGLFMYPTVYATEKGLKSKYSNTVIFVKKADGRFLVYALDGGP